jgi:hypothetical protein
MKKIHWLDVAGALLMAHVLMWAFTGVSLVYVPDGADGVPRIFVLAMIHVVGVVASAMRRWG